MVEGQTERTFAEAVLKPHLVEFQLEMRAILVTTNRKLGSRSGVLRYAHVRADLERHMRQDKHSEAYFTTMIDYYGLSADFPGWGESRRESTSEGRVAVLERALREDLGDRRFIPYFQLHEFEALLYCDLSQLARRISGSEDVLDLLAREVQGASPEEVNEGDATAPSKRIIRYVPLYEKLKVRVGSSAAAAIGLPELRDNCPHFDAWVSRLERLSSS